MEPATSTKKAYSKKSKIVKIHQIIWYITWIIEIIFAFRTIFKLLGANPESSFVSFIYSLSDIFGFPFLRMFESSVINRTEFEWSIYVAMIVYIIAAWLLINLFKLAKPESPREIDEKL